PTPPPGLRRSSLGRGPRHPWGPSTARHTTHVATQEKERVPSMSLHDTSDVFDAGHDHEQVVFANDPATGLRAIVAIHSTALGPALGGTRFFPSPTPAAALSDVLDLSRGMSYKAALAGLDLGGGKAVIIGDPAHVRAGGGGDALV